jgi:perosamine synthetase
MKEKGVDTRPVFYPIHHMPFYHSSWPSDDQFENTIAIAREGISLPTYIGLQRDDIEYITDALFSSIDTINK